MIDPTGLTIEQAGRAFAAGRLRADDLLEAYLARIARLNPGLNAFIAVVADEARAMAAESQRRIEAGRPRSRLEGIPVGLKDNIDLRGVATTNGLAYGPVAARDARATALLRDAGAVLLGKLNMDECALGGTTRNPHRGMTHNPWRPGHTPGGSSGGPAAAVAARLCAAALGTDTMGSVRLPAAYCGVAGLKPTQGLVSTEGVATLSGSLDHVGPLARNVRDLALVFDALAGSREPGQAPGATEGGIVPALSGLGFGVVANFAAIRTEPGVRAAFDALIARLRASGASVDAVELPEFDPFSARRAGLLVVEAEGACACDLRGSEWGAPATHTARMFAFGRALPPGALARARELLERGAAAFNDLLPRFDAILSPAAPQAAFAFDAPEPANQAEYTALANFAGCPALSIPFALDDGLPLGLQVMAPRNADRRLLRIGAALEAWIGFAQAPVLDMSE